MKPTVNDTMLRDAVIQELEGDPELSAKYISVTARNGAISLGGHVMTYHEKHVAVRAVERVDAVRVVADDIEVRPEALHERSDDEIAEEIARLRGLDLQNRDSVSVEVQDGRVVLHGEVETASERTAIEDTARKLTGVRAVDNLIDVRPPTKPVAADVERRVREAIAHMSDLDAGSVRVTLDDTTAQLHGQLPSAQSLETALQAAETAPGVTAVESDVVVTIASRT